MIAPSSNSIAGRAVHGVLIAMLLSAYSGRAAAEEFTAAIQAYLRQCH